MGASSRFGEENRGAYWASSLFFWLADRLRPRLGWFAFLLSLALVLLPVSAVVSARWVNVQRSGAHLNVAAAGGLVLTWLLVSWWQRQPGRGRAILAGLAWVVGTSLLIPQSLVGWLPGPLTLWQLGRTGNWAAIGVEMWTQLQSLGWRLLLWAQGVGQGGAIQDDLIFLFWIALGLWLIAALTALLALQIRRGLLLALPVLWSLTALLYYSRGERILLIAGLGLAILLQLWLDQQNLEREWRIQAIDFSPSLFYDRALAAVGMGVVILLLGLVLPGVSIRPITNWSYEFFRPVYEPVEDLNDRLFPDLAARGWGPGSGLGSGLPNRFLLGDTPDLARIPVAWVRTSLSSPFPDQPPPGIYLRRGTFSIYDGQGWDNPNTARRVDRSAAEGWADDLGAGRRPVLQQVRTADPVSLLLAAGEPVEPSIDYSAFQRGQGDLIGLWTAGETVRRYQVRSAVPGAPTEALLALTGDDLTQIPEQIATHLALPSELDPRIAETARTVTADQTTLYAQAQALEAYLRAFPYDLDVPSPPPGEDVAAYFLFDVQRGYCDYYATAFVVMARSLGIPTRFVTGYVPGDWLSNSQEWLITEAEAHSWPEVYFPGYGWIPFEPTGGRAPLDRLAGVQRGQPLPPSALEEALNFETAETPAYSWNWQMLVWLLPILLLLWGGWRWWRRPGESAPWPGLVAWGRGVGRPLGVGETELEYGDAVTQLLLASDTLSREPGPEGRRRLVRQLTELIRAITESRYAQGDLRERAAERAARLWDELRHALKRM